MRTALLVLAMAAAAFAVGALPRRPVTCRTVVRFGRDGRWLTPEGAMFDLLMSR